jgi:NAD(P)H-flavin reductase
MLAAAERWGAGDRERPWLPRAFSFLRAQDGQLSFLLEDVGPGTARLAELQGGDELWIMGPLGIGFEAPDARRRALLCGGGIGVVPLAGWQDELAAGGTAPSALLGFRDAWHAEAARLLVSVTVATDDGSVGETGFVTALLARELDADPHAVVYACGPPPMLEAVRALCAERSVPAQLAMESGMACGFGACFGCVVPTRTGYVRLCVDGPVLDAEDLESALVAGAGHT